MNVLVAGGTGFVGTALCRELVDRGHDVTAMSRDPNSSELPAGVETARGDATNYGSIVDVVSSHEAVVNLVSLSPLFQPPGGTSHEEVHLGGTQNLVRAAEDGGVRRFVQMSGIRADPNGATAFLRAKGRAEELVRESKLEWVIVRPAVIFGDGGEFIPFTKLVTTPYVTGLPAGGRIPFQPIWIGDVVPMLADCVEDDGRAGETYELGGPEVVTLADATELVYDANGKSVRILSVPMTVAKIGLTVAGPIPFVPFGPEQVRSLELDYRVNANDISAFGRSPAELTTLEEYLTGGDQRSKREMAGDEERLQ